MATEDTRSFMEERLLAMDPDLDVAEGSPAYDQVIDPTVRRYTPDPFEVDLEKFIDTRLLQEHPDLNVKEGSGLRDALVKPMQILMDPIYREVNILKQNQSLANPELLSPADADSLVANVFVSRSTGGLATGTIRIYFNAPVALTISIGNVCYTSSGLRFLPTTLQSITAEAMVFNQSGNLYYFDIQVTAEKAGSEYSIDKDLIVGITNLNAAVRVNNTERFEGGLDEQSTADLVSNAEQSITERSLVVGRGVVARLYDVFDSLKHLQVVGFTDAEMERDIITGGNFGPILFSGNGGYTEDDGDGDLLSYRFKIRDSINFIDDIFGSIGDVSNYWLSVSEISYGDSVEIPGINLDHFILSGYRFSSDDIDRYFITSSSPGSNPENVGVWKIAAIIDIDEVRVYRTSPGVAEAGISWIMVRPGIDAEIESVITSTELKLLNPLPVDLAIASWVIRKKEIAISDIPGGITSILDAQSLELQSDQLHIGGCSDFYVRGTTVEEETLVLEAVSDENAVVSAETLVTSSVNTEFVSDTNYNFVELGVLTGHSLIIETGADAGVKTIFRAGVHHDGSSNPNWLQVDPPLTSTASGIRYKIVNEIDINLRQPRTMRGVGTDLQTLQLSSSVTTASTLDFTSLGTEVGDVFRILSGVDQGDYTIIAISGTGNRTLVLSSQLNATVSSLGWEVFKAGEGLDFPLVRISGLDILDSSQQPTGNVVPYADPVDSRSTAFANAGHGTKVSTTDGITGILGSRDITIGAAGAPTYPLAATTLNVRINNASPILVTLTGAATPEIIVDTINGTSGLFNIADLLSMDGELRLVLRSTDRWIIVDPGATNDMVGLDVAVGEDNRQIRSLNNISDWSDADYGLMIERDSVYVTTGDNIGFYYLVAAQTGRILVVGVDESDGRALFLHPNVRVSLRAGSRSYGKARVYFLDPTTFSAHGAWRPPLKNSTDYPANASIGRAIPVDERPVTYFTADVGGSLLRFVPDPELKYSVLPASGDTIPNNMNTEDAVNLVVSNDVPSENLGKNSRDAKVDFLDREILEGDLVEITHTPIQGDKDMGLISFTSPGDLANLTLILSIDGAPAKTHTFTDQLTSIDGILGEINATFGMTLAYKELLTGPAETMLRLEADVDVIWHKNSTCNSLFWNTFGSSNKHNLAPANTDGYYIITKVTETGDPIQHHKLEIEDENGVAPAATAQAQHFKVFRPGMQHIHSTDMAENLEIGLYYMDVELVSEGPGDEWNLDAEVLFSLEGYVSDGYRLSVSDANLSYSEEEQVMMVLSRRILTVGQSDRPDQATKLSLQNLQVNYDRSSLAASVQAFASADLERVLNASLLVRHLQPHYLNFEMIYRGGSSADVIRDDVLEYLDELGPEESVEVSDIQNLALRRGATYIQNPITLVAITHDENRVIAVVRSKNYVSRSRLATFFAEDITIEKETVTVL